MNTIKIYKIECTKAYQMSEQHGPTFSLDGWGGNTDYYEGQDDGGTDYALPDGFEVAESIGYGLQIYRLDPAGDECCDLARHPCGRPQIWTRRHRNPVLDLAPEAVRA